MESIEVPIEHEIIDEFRDVVYEQNFGNTNDSHIINELKMSLLVPRNKKPHPAVLYFPGGGFTKSDYHKFIDFRYALARAGFVVAGAQYRVIPSIFPDPVIDGKAALRYLRVHSDEFNIDPNKIGVLGDSAGGYLAQMIAVTADEDFGQVNDGISESVQAVVSLYGLSDLLTVGSDFDQKIQASHKSPASPEAVLLNGLNISADPHLPIQENIEQAKKASPLYYVKHDVPPMLLMAGDQDTLVSPSQSKKMYQALQDENVETQLVMIRNAGHGTIEWHQDEIIEQVVDWFIKYL
ncbi:alpha/beta hydrolase [Companilactobacillus baiquanensis]|uniref:Alpha/beta hydrolase fold domain-containing protein n=1 Tax=Companilactobacillus baiquanensis TaxID=2486005 RepID=A0ABW1UW22_9LACO|nr:alpha/beta hydrolase [Companilactobacillus baiquanensis]